MGWLCLIIVLYIGFELINDRLKEIRDEIKNKE